MKVNSLLVQIGNSLVQLKQSNVLNLFNTLKMCNFYIKNDLGAQYKVWQKSYKC